MEIFPMLAAHAAIWEENTMTTVGCLACHQAKACRVPAFPLVACVARRIVRKREANVLSRTERDKGSQI